MTLPVINQLAQWWCRRGTKARCFAVVFALIVLSINVLYLPVHMIVDHHGHDHQSQNEQHSSEREPGSVDHDSMEIEGVPAHEGSDHNLPSLRFMAPMVAAVAPSVQVIYFLPPTRAPKLLIDTEWRPTSTDSDRAPPGPSRAPPV